MSESTLVLGNLTVSASLNGALKARGEGWLHKAGESWPCYGFEFSIDRDNVLEIHPSHGSPRQRELIAANVEEIGVLVREGIGFIIRSKLEGVTLDRC
mgnify:FL=1